MKNHIFQKAFKSTKPRAFVIIGCQQLLHRSYPPLILAGFTEFYMGLNWFQSVAPRANILEMKKYVCLNSHGIEPCYLV